MTPEAKKAMEAIRDYCDKKRARQGYAARLHIARARAMDTGIAQTVLKNGVILSNEEYYACR